MKKMFFTLFALSISSVLAQELTAYKVDSMPEIDGLSDDSAWKDAEAVTTHDKVAKTDVTLKAVYNDKQVAVLVRFPDKTKNVEHKTMRWDKKQKRYTTGNQREDTFVFKWNMEPNKSTDLTLSSDTPYKADIWYWKAFRTGTSGFADDKFQIYSDIPMPKSQKKVSKNGQLFYLTRKGDEGKSTYKKKLYFEYAGDQLPAYESRVPKGSRSDVKANGHYENGYWTIEFIRNLNTGNSDDVVFDPKNSYYFGVSKYEIAGKKPNEKIEQPFYNSGEISDLIKLKFQ